MKIKAKNPAIFGANLTVPYQGVISIGTDGVVEVSEKAGNFLVSSTNDWEEVKGEVSSKGKKNDEEKDADETFLSNLKKATLEELVAMATEAGYPEEDWKNFAKKQKLMVAYLTKKYNEAALADDKGEE